MRTGGAGGEQIRQPELTAGNIDSKRLVFYLLMLAKHMNRQQNRSPPVPYTIHLP
jgi:hypothetical protein